MNLNSENSIVALAGKGGVGKTALSCIFTKILLANGRKLLVIDADPVINLAFSLGEEPSKTIGAFREEIIEFPEEAKKVKSDRPTREIIRDFVIESDRGFSLLVMGRAEGPGCFCSLNDLLRYGIESLSKDFDVVLVDCEAGIEQVNRRVIHTIDKLFLVTDPNKRAIEAASRVRDIARKYNVKKTLESYLIVNRVRNSEDRDHLQEAAQGLGMNILGYIPEDGGIRNFNLNGKPLIDLPDDSPSVTAFREILRDFRWV